MDIKRKENLFYVGDNDNNPDGYVKFSFRDENTIAIDSTFVDAKLRGQGVAQKLTAKVAELAREEEYKVIPVCSYAVKFFEADEYKDLVK